MNTEAAQYAPTPEEAAAYKGYAQKVEQEVNSALQHFEVVADILTSDERENLPKEQAREVVQKLLLKLSVPSNNFGNIKNYYLEALKEVTGKENTDLSTSAQLSLWFAVLFESGFIGSNVNKSVKRLSQEFNLEKRSDDPTPDEILKLIFAEVAQRMSQSDGSVITEQPTLPEETDNQIV